MIWRTLRSKLNLNMTNKFKVLRTSLFEHLTYIDEDEYNCLLFRESSDDDLDTYFWRFKQERKIIWYSLDINENKNYNKVSNLLLHFYVKIKFFLQKKWWWRDDCILHEKKIVEIDKEERYFNLHMGRCFFFN